MERHSSLESVTAPESRLVVAHGLGQVAHVRARHRGRVTERQVDDLSLTGPQVWGHHLSRGAEEPAQAGEYVSSSPLWRWLRWARVRSSS